jgi:hypothetical protein
MSNSSKAAQKFVQSSNETVKVVINNNDRSQDKIVVTSGKGVRKEIPALVFDSQQTLKIYQLIAED